MKKVAIPLSEEQVKLFHSLARELVQAYQTKENILKSLSLSEEGYELIVQNATFQRILRQLMSEWNSATNTSKRVKLKSQWAVEEAIPFLFQAMTDNNEPLSARAEVFKSLSKVGQLDVHDQLHTSDRSFRLEINIGAGVPTVTINSDTRIESSHDVIEHENNESDWDIDKEPNSTVGSFVPANIGHFEDK